MIMIGVIVTLEESLLRHDWYYQYADDFRVWDIGEKNQKILQAQLADSPFSWAEVFKAFTTKDDPKKAEILSWARGKNGH